MATKQGHLLNYVSVTSPCKLPLSTHRVACILGSSHIVGNLGGAWDRVGCRTNENCFFPGPGLAEMSNGCIVLDAEVCTDNLEAFKPCGDFKDTSK